MWLLMLLVKFILTSSRKTAILSLVIRLQKLAGPAIEGVPAGAPFPIFGGDVCGEAFLIL